MSTSGPHAWLEAARLSIRWLRDVPALHALARRLYPAAGVQALRMRVLLQWRILCHYRLHCALLVGFSHPELAPVLARHPRLLRKVYTPYARGGLAPKDRLAWLLRHFALARALMSPPMFHTIFAGDGLKLCELPLPQGQGMLPVHLAKNPRFESEGDMTLSLHDPFGTPLYSVTLSLYRHHGRTGLLIGCINGLAPQDAVKHLTQVMQGLRPQSLMVQLAQSLARHFGASELCAVGSGSHVYAGSPRAGHVTFDYDALWLEHGGRLRSDRLYALPLHTPRRTLQAMPSQKRAQYRRRYDFLDAMETGMADGLWRAQFQPARPRAAQPG